MYLTFSFKARPGPPHSATLGGGGGCLGFVAAAVSVEACGLHRKSVGLLFLCVCYHWALPNTRVGVAGEYEGMVGEYPLAADTHEESMIGGWSLLSAHKHKHG